MVVVEPAATLPASESPPDGIGTAPGGSACTRSTMEGASVAPEELAEIASLLVAAASAAARGAQEAPPSGGSAIMALPPLLSPPSLGVMLPGSMAGGRGWGPRRPPLRRAHTARDARE